MLSPNYLLQLLKEEVTEFLRSTKDICIDNNPKALNIIPQVTALRAVVAKLDDTLLYDRESKFTEQLEKLDIDRDNAVMSIRYGFLMNLYHEDPLKKIASQVLLDHLEGYGIRITKLNYEAESTVLINLTNDYQSKSDLKEALQYLGLTERATRIKNSNLKFREKYKEHISAESTFEKISFTILKPKAIEIYTDLLNYLNAYIMLDKTGTYDNIKNQLDALGNRYLQILKTRRNNIVSNQPITQTTEEAN